MLGNLGMECKFYPYFSEYDTNISLLVNTVTYYDHLDGNIYTLRVN